jgi:hypothetical protein
VKSVFVIVAVAHFAPFAFVLSETVESLDTDPKILRVQAVARFVPFSLLLSFAGAVEALCAYVGVGSRAIRCTVVVLEALKLSKGFVRVGVQSALDGVNCLFWGALRDGRAVESALHHGGFSAEGFGSV